MERRITLTGQLNPCRCGKQPQLFFNSIGEKYHMECPVCLLRLYVFTSASEAIQHWESISEFHLPVDAAPATIPVAVNQ